MKHPYVYGEKQADLAGQVATLKNADLMAVFRIVGIEFAKRCKMCPLCAGRAMMEITAKLNHACREYGEACTHEEGWA